MKSLVALFLSCIPLVAAEDTDFFENKVRPVLANNCYACHTNSEMGGLRVDTREGVALRARLREVVHALGR